MKRLATLLTTAEKADPRWYQILSLSCFLAVGLFFLGFDLSPRQVVVTIGSALFTQVICNHVARLPKFEVKSGLISALSLCLLLRTEALWVAAFCSAVAISSKFIFRVGGKHLFNPTNLALVVALLFLQPHAWVSSGQWGAVGFRAFLFLCLGMLVVTRARRLDVTAAFLLSYAGLLLSRSLWLNEPLAIPLHRLENGALLLFAFFMISDPKTTPDSRAGRIIFGILVAIGAAYVQFKLFRPNGLIYSLALFSLLCPLIDWLLPGQSYSWKHPGPLAVTSPVKVGAQQLPTSLAHGRA
jgi:Na+-transporting NADH:ubiquinone oxidoreductase subunit NqrB